MSFSSGIFSFLGGCSLGKALDTGGDVTLIVGDMSLLLVAPTEILLPGRGLD